MLITYFLTFLLINYSDAPLQPVYSVSMQPINISSPQLQLEAPMIMQQDILIWQHVTIVPTHVHSAMPISRVESQQLHCVVR